MLAQVPLTVSPFVSLPTAATLPYTYKTMPSTLPPPATGITGATDEKPQYVVSQSGHAAHPNDIIASCKALQAHVTKLKEDADRELKALEERIREAELAEKRRVAPGWLDSETHLLQPERKPGTEAEAEGSEVAGSFAAMSLAERQGASELDQGAELDRAFAGK